MKLKIELDDRVVFDHEVQSIHLNNFSNKSEIVSNPLFAAAMAGAKPETLLDLPGEQVVGYEGAATTTIELVVQGFYEVTFLRNPVRKW